MQYTRDDLMAAVEQFGSKRAAAKALGISDRTLRRRLNKKPEPFLEAVANGVGFPADDVSGYWVKSGEGSFYVKRDFEDEKTKDFIDGIKEALIDCKDALTLPELVEDCDSELLTTYPLPDLHIGMRAWAEETGIDWDLDIAKKVILEKFAALVSQSRPSKRALIVNLGDYFHANDGTNETPRSKHKLDVDGRGSKVALVGVEIMRSMIEMVASKHETIEFRSVKGNHDDDSSIILPVAFWLAFGDSPRIEINTTPKQLSYFSHGKVLLGFFHGHTMKAERAAMAMACEVPELWGKAEFYHMMHGHFHTASLKEVGKVLVEGLQTVIPRDAYAAASGYTSGRSLTAITYHAERGEIGRHKVNV